MIQIVAVPPWEARAVMRPLWPLLLRACSRGCDLHPMTFVLDAEKRQAVIWLACDGNAPIGICITKKHLRDSDNRSVIYVAVCGGFRFREWLGVLRERVHAFKEAEGAAFLEWRGRKGWARALGLMPLGQDEQGHWIFEDYGDG